MLKKVLHMAVLLFFMAMVAGIFYAKVLMAASASGSGPFRETLVGEKAMLYSFAGALSSAPGRGSHRNGVRQDANEAPVRRNRPENRPDRSPRKMRGSKGKKIPEGSQDLNID